MRLILALCLLLALPAAAHADEFDLPWPEDLTGECEVAPAAASPIATAAGGPTVRATLRRAAAEGRITREDAQAWEALYERSLRTRRRLPASRRGELGAVISGVEDLARRRLLSSSRMPLVFLQLQRNVEWWPRRGGPRTPQAPPSERPCAGQSGLGGARVTFGKDPIVFQWYPGLGLQIQPLAMFGTVNGRAKNCVDEDERTRCRPELLRRGLDRIVSMQVDRGDFRAWEYLFRFGGGTPPWISGLATATAMQALSRGSVVLGEPAYLRAARRARPAFQRSTPLGVRARGTYGPHYVLYSFAPGLRVLNGFLHALTGIYDYAETADDDVARRLFREGDRQARREVPLADTGAWSRYSAGGAESDLGYHRLVRDFLQNLCDRTKTSVYCRTASRFTRYQTEPVRLKLLKSAPTTARFWLSKVSCVTLKIRRGDRVVSSRDLTLGRGTRSIPWSAPRRGKYTVEITAEDLNRHRTTVTRTVEVRRR